MVDHNKPKYMVKILDCCGQSGGHSEGSDFLLVNSLQLHFLKLYNILAQVYF